MLSVRLACIKHAASVHPEPGSNSPFDDSIFKNLIVLGLNELTFCLIASYLVFKDRIASHQCLPFGAHLWGAYLYYQNKELKSTTFFTFFIFVINVVFFSSFTLFQTAVRSIS